MRLIPSLGTVVWRANRGTRHDESFDEGLELARIERTPGLSFVCVLWLGGHVEWVPTETIIMADCPRRRSDLLLEFIALVASRKFLPPPPGGVK